MTQQRTAHIAIEDLVDELGLLKEDVLRWIKRDNPDISLDHMGRECISIKFLDRYSNEEEYTEALKKALNLENLVNSDNSDMAQKWKNQKLESLDLYETYIQDLENLHRKYLSLVNNTGHESKTMAAYLLFARVIATLKTCCLCQRHDHWYWASMLREIEECLAVAEYFTIRGDHPQGKTDLRKWFRQLHHSSPSYTIFCRAISKDLTFENKDFTEKENNDFISMLYSNKCTLTHPCYRFIRDVTKYKTLSDGSIIVEKVEYGACDYHKKHLEFSDLFKSQIWNSFLTFYKCFYDIPLMEDDRKLVIEICKKIHNEETEDFIKKNQRLFS
ncbi:MAG: hypothetical protein K2Y01_07820 [Rhabdochlamydiaceae bacterium]|nr:hypothetical protein [Rhabdochlamydiaceae bacterium]